MKKRGVALLMAQYLRLQIFLDVEEMQVEMARLVRKKKYVLWSGHHRKISQKKWGMATEYL